MNRRLSWICIALALASLAYHALVSFGDWRTTSAYEQEWVASALAQGHGFSFPAGSAWLGPYEGASEFSPTAWVVPVQPLLIAACYRVFRGHAHLALLALNFVWTAAACWAAYRLGMRLQGPASGWAAALGVAFLPTIAPPAAWLLGRYIGNAALTGLLFLLCALLVVRCVERPSLRRGVELGALLGLTALTHASSLLFPPVVAVTLVWAAGSPRTAAVKAAAVVIVTSCVVIAPWAVRNTLRFGEFVPLRNGAGFQLHLGNPALAGTLGFEVGDESQPAPWASASVRESIARLQTTEGDRALRAYAQELVLASAPAAYPEFNEAQRDSLYMRQTREFVLAEPWLALRLSIAKTTSFFFIGWSWWLGAVSGLALLGLAATIRDRRSLAVFVLVPAFAAPSALSTPIYYRYRGPIDPLLLVFAGIAVVVGLQVCRRSAR